MNQITVGITAHVDAGKTTLSEAILYETGQIHEKGRVDKGTSFLDTDEIERKKGITVFSKQAVAEWDGFRMILVDTPGHSDFSAETERALKILDCALLVISATDGVQSHTETIWKLLAQYRIPVFIFISKNDIATAAQKNSMLQELQTKLDLNCIAADSESFFENASLTKETAFEEYLNTDTLSPDTVHELIFCRKIFPVYFGSGLKQEGVSSLLNGIRKYASVRSSGNLDGTVHKIRYDENSTRLTFCKINSGSLSIREELAYIGSDQKEYHEKITDIRLYSGDKYTKVKEALPGGIYAFAGLTHTFSGMGIGSCASDSSSMLLPCISYAISAIPPATQYDLYQKLLILDEEDPSLHIMWNPTDETITIRLMGSMQTLVLQDMLLRRFGIRAVIEKGSVLYRETISSITEGVGHYEPLRHYAEVHLIMKPLAPGDGLIFRANCAPNSLERNWQRLIMTHLQEKEHLGVLTGSPITDMEISLVAGKAHLKHTEGGDFREATYRAVRNGLMRVQSVLLEPFYSFVINIPGECLGRAIQDLQEMHADYTYEINPDGSCSISGKAPVDSMNDYQEILAMYSHGTGKLFCDISGYFPCKNQDTIVKSIGYQPESDPDNSPDSVFCSHGSGHIVKWNEIRSYQHIPDVLNQNVPLSKAPKPQSGQKSYNIDEEELNRILEREFGPIRRKQYGIVSAAHVKNPQNSILSSEVRKNIILIDGYNLLYIWPFLRDIAPLDLELAREKLIDLLCSYAGISGRELILVFDAYRVPHGLGEKEYYKNITLVYTKEAETADAYIERLCHEAKKNELLTVVTSDSLIQLSADTAGIKRISSKDFSDQVIKELENMRKRMDVSSHGI